MKKEEVHPNPDSQLLLSPEYFLEKLNDVRSKLGLRKGPATLWMKERESEDIILPQEMDLSNGINTMSRTLADFEKGIAIFTGLPNCGKSTLLINMELQSLQLNPDLIVVDLSFDDPIDKRYQQWVASLTGLYYQDITTDTELSEDKKNKRKKADEFIDQMIKDGRLHLYSEFDRFKDKNGRDLEVEFLKISNIVKLMSNIRRKYPDKKIAMFVDAWNDLDLQMGRTDSEVQAAQAAAKTLKLRAEENDIRLIISAHLRKTQGRTPALEDLKGSNYLSFAAVWVGIVRNEFRENTMNNPLMYEYGNKLIPILTVRNVKNKVSTWDMDLYYALLSGQGTVIPLTREEYSVVRSEAMGKIKD